MEIISEAFEFKPRNLSSSMKIIAEVGPSISEEEFLNKEAEYERQFEIFVDTMEAVLTTIPKGLHDPVMTEVKARQLKKEQLIFFTTDGFEVEIPNEVKIMMGELPFSRKYIEVGAGRKNPRIEIMAPLRMGKTTLAGVLHEQLKVLGIGSELWQEDFKGNPHWEAMSNEPTSETVRLFQEDFLKKDIDIICQAGNNGIASIYEVPEVNDFAYALNNFIQGRMSEGDFSKYLSYFRYGCVFEAHSIPDLLILVTTTDKNYLRRALDNARVEEGGLEEKYYLTLKAIVEGFFGKMDYVNRLTIVTDNFDFSDNGDRQEEVAGEVLKALEQIGFQDL